MGNLRRICLLTVCGLFLLCLGGRQGQTTKAEDAPPVSVSTHFAGTPQELKVYTLRGAGPGPTVLIVAGIHGDEAAGYLTAERYVDLRLTRGSLIVIPRLNAPAIRAGKRRGLGGDMNRLFNLPSDSANPDAKVVAVVKDLVKKADYVLNLHQGYDFYNPRWISRVRNPSKWGQSHVIDAAVFNLPGGRKLELAKYARRVAQRANRHIPNGDYHFEVNNTNTALTWSRHKEQRGSLTYYSLYDQKKMALGLEATKNCPLADAVSYLTVAVNAALLEAGIEARAMPEAVWQGKARRAEGPLRSGLSRG